MFGEVWREGSAPAGAPEAMVSAPNVLRQPLEATVIGVPRTQRRRLW